MCADGNPDCDHLFQNGAVDTIVRLPDSVRPLPSPSPRPPLLTEGSFSTSAVQSDALCARSKALDPAVQHVRLPRHDCARERRAGPLFGARRGLCSRFATPVSAGNSNRSGLVLTRHGRNGSVYFTVQGLNVAGSNGAFASTTPAAVHQRRRQLDRRWSNGSAHRRGNFFEDALQSQHSLFPGIPIRVSPPL